MFLASLGICSAAALRSQQIYLSQAIASQKVKAQFAATGYLEGVNTNSHVGKCLQYQLRNTSTSPMTIQLDAGYIFKPEDTTIQPLMVTENKTWVLAAGATIKGYLNALCAAHAKAGPVKERKYSLGNIGSKIMQKFANFVAGKKYQNNNAQAVLWAITDQRDLYGTFTPGKPEDDDFINFVKQEMKIDPTKPGQVFVHKKEVEKKVSVRISETFESRDSGQYMIQICDMAGIAKLQRQMPDRSAPGEISETFWISTAELPVGKYQVKFIINRKEAHSSTFELKFDEGG